MNRTHRPLLIGTLVLLALGAFVVLRFEVPAARQEGLIDPHNGKIIGLVVETGCSYFGELKFPDKLVAGIRVAHLGNSSVRYEIALFRGEEERAAAQGHFVHVYVDRESREPQTLDTGFRGRLEDYIK